MKSLTTFLTLIAFAVTVFAGEPVLLLKEDIKADVKNLPSSDPNASGITLLGPLAKTVERTSSTEPVTVPAGRFFAFTPTDGSPSYLSPNDAYRIYIVKPGGNYIGVRFDAPEGSEPEAHEWPDAKGPVYVFLARNKPGDYTLQLIKNGPAETGPVANGKATLVRIGYGPQPPPAPIPPGPNPAPSPTGEAAWVVILEETSQRTLELGDLMDKMRVEIPKAGHKYRSYDKDQPDIPPGYKKSVDNLPELIVVSLKGVELYRGTIKKGTKYSEISETVKRVTGR